MKIYKIVDEDIPEVAGLLKDPAKQTHSLRIMAVKRAVGNSKSVVETVVTSSRDVTMTITINGTRHELGSFKSPINIRAKLKELGYEAVDA